MRQLYFSCFRRRRKKKSWTGARSPCVLKNVARGWGAYTTATKASGSAPSSIRVLQVLPGFCRSSGRRKQPGRVHLGCGTQAGALRTPSRFAQKVDRPCPCSSLLPLRFFGGRGAAPCCPSSRGSLRVCMLCGGTWGALVGCGGGIGGAGGTEVIDPVAVLECGEQSHVAATTSSSFTFPCLLRGKSGSREVRRSEAQSGGARGPEEVRAGRVVDPERPKGRQLEAAEASATPVAKDKGRLVLPPEPAGSRRGPRPALWSPAVQHPLPPLLPGVGGGSGWPEFLPPVLRTPQSAKGDGGGQSRAPRALGPLADEYL